MHAWLFIVAGGFLAGVLWRSLSEVGLAEVALLAVVAGVALLLIAQRSVRYGALAVVCLAAGALGIARTEGALRTYHARAELVPDGLHLDAIGTVVEEPDVRERNTLLTIALEHSGETVRVRASVPHYPLYAYGDRVTVRGVVREPESFTTETDRVFDYPGYLLMRGVHAEIHTATVFHVGGAVGGSSVQRALFTAKQLWLDTVSYLLPEPSAALAGGLIVGAKQSLGERWLRLFREVGLIHIVVLSGYNLTIVAQGLLAAVKRAPRFLAFGVGALGIVGFALMTGASSTVVRASIMALCALAGRLSGQPYTVVRALVLAAVLMVAWNPFVLIFDPGFELSFIATIGLIFGSPLVLHMIRVVPLWGWLREIVAATISTQLAVLPLIATTVGTVSPIALVANVLVLPVVAPIMVLGFLAGVLGMLALPLGLPLALVAHALLAYIFLIVRTCAALPGASFVAPALSPVVAVGAYVVLVGAVWYAYAARGWAAYTPGEVYPTPPLPRRSGQQPSAS